MRLLPLGNSTLMIIVDQSWYEKLSGWKWLLHKNGYAMRYEQRGKVRRCVRLHRVVAGTPPGFITDHINGNKLDNRAHNLRVCSYRENNMNVPKKRIKNGKSQYKGVHLVAGKYWSARICKNGKEIHLGSFRSEVDAARAYDAAALIHFGEFARPNFDTKGNRINGKNRSVPA